MARHVRPHGVARELEVRLVDEHERVGGVEQVDQERLGLQVAGRVVRVRDHDDVDVAFLQAREHRLLVDREVLGPPRDLHDLGAGHARVEPVHRERRRHVEQLAARSAPREHQVEDQLVAAVAHEHVAGVQTVGVGDVGPQRTGHRVRVAVERELGQPRGDGGDHLVGQVQRVLVGRQVGLDLRLLGLVGHEVGELRARRAQSRHVSSPRRRSRRPLRSRGAAPPRRRGPTDPPRTRSSSRWGRRPRAPRASTR